MDANKMPNRAAQSAEFAAGGSAFLAGAAWIANVEPYITTAAALVAIFAGATAAWYHIERALDMRRKRLKEEADG